MWSNLIREKPKGGEERRARLGAQPVLPVLPPGACRLPALGSGPGRWTQHPVILNVMNLVIVCFFHSITCHSFVSNCGNYVVPQPVAIISWQDNYCEFPINNVC